MRRISLISLALLTVMLVPVMAAASTPPVNGANITQRVFNDCPFTTFTFTNNFPSAITMTDDHLACSGFANLYTWTLSSDGGATEAVFNNNADVRVSADLVIDGSSHGEAGLRVSPWWSHEADGKFNVRIPDGEIACFGGRLPFYSFTANYGLHYAAGQPIHLEITYKPHGLNASSPATIEYEVGYQGNTYSSGVLAFDSGNLAEDPPHGLWGILQDARVGGYFQPGFVNGDFSAKLTGTFTNIHYVICPVEPDPDHDVVNLRVFNDCPFTSINVTNNYPSHVQISDGPTVCTGFANMHTWSVSDDGNVEHAIENDDDFSIACDFSLTGPGEGGLRVSPWWSHEADGLFNLRSTDGEIACFGGRLPFYSFSAQSGVRYTPGQVAHLEIIYKHNGLSQASPGTIEYKLGLGGNNYDSGPLNFDQANTSEDPPHGLWGILNDARAGGHMKAFMFTSDKTATVVGTFDNIVFKSGAGMAVKITPSAFNATSNGNSVGAVLQPAAPYAAADIDVSSLRLNGQVGPSAAILGDANGDGVPDLTVKFDRAPANDAISAAGGSGTVTGDVNGVCFTGSDNVKLVTVKHPASGVSVAPGSTVGVDWDTPAGITVNSADVYSSLDGGNTWNAEAQGIANSGHYNWHVGQSTSSNARVAVVLNAGSQSASGLSGVFTIASPVGVGDPEAVAFALKGVSPNPSQGPLGVSFSLPDSKRTTLSVFDVSGRRVAMREVGGLGAGRHTVSIGNRLAAGMYMIRLDRVGASLTTRAAVIQ